MTITTIQPDSAAGLDIYIRDTSPNDNFNWEDDALKIGEQNSGGGTITHRSLIKFTTLSDHSIIPVGGIVESAVLTLTLSTDYSDNERYLRVYRCKRVWGETSATWNRYDGVNYWQNPGGFGSDDCEQTDIGATLVAAAIPATVDITLTASKIQEMISGAFTDNGFLLKMDTELNDEGMYAASGHATAGARPKLVVTWHAGLNYSNVSGSLPASGSLVAKAGKVLGGALSSIIGTIQYPGIMVYQKSISGTIGSISGVLSDARQFIISKILIRLK